MLVILTILTGSAYGYIIIELILQKPIEQSKTLYHNSILTFLLGIILAGSWYIVGLTSASHSSFCFGNTLNAIIIALLSIISGIRHLRNYREFNGNSGMNDGAEGEI